MKCGSPAASTSRPRRRHRRFRARPRMVFASSPVFRWVTHLNRTAIRSATRPFCRARSARLAPRTTRSTSCGRSRSAEPKSTASSSPAATPTRAASTAPGGAVLLEGSAGNNGITYRACRFLNNSEEGFGGAGAVRTDGVTFADCLFLEPQSWTGTDHEEPRRAIRDVHRSHSIASRGDRARFRGLTTPPAHGASARLLAETRFAGFALLSRQSRVLGRGQPVTPPPADAR